MSRRADAERRSRCGRACTTSAAASPPSSRSRATASFRRVVARERVDDLGRPGPRAEGARHRASSAHEQYYYRFSTRTTDGPVGRFRTALPADSRQPVRFAFWSCQDFTHGFYNAHDVLAARGPRLRRLPRRLHLRRDRGDGRDRGARRPHRQHRARPARARRSRSTTTARSTASTAPTRPLRRVHARFPTVMLWDDHEVQDNYAGGEPDGGLPPAAALQPRPQARRRTRPSSSRCRTRRRAATASTAR